jgi:hypothetical protein
MRSYVGQDVRRIELDYGPPSNAIDLGNGQRAFQWTRITVSRTPGSAVTTTSKDKKGRKIQNTTYSPPTHSVDRCLYTFFAAWNPQANGWIVTGIREPSLDCAIGDLGS